MVSALGYYCTLTRNSDVMLQLTVSYGLMALSLYTAAFRVTKLNDLARIMACGTVVCLSLFQLQ